MENLSLSAEVRNTSEKTKEIRANKKLPAVVYGHKQEALSITLDYSDFLRTFRKSGESHIINLDVEGKKIEVLVHDFQKNVVTEAYTHVDFYAVTKGEALTTKIHLNFTGASQAAKEGAIIDEHMKEIEVKCLPKDLVDAIDVDLSKLVEMGDSIRVSDLKVDASKLHILNNADDIVVSASKPAKVEEISNEAPEAPATEEDTKA